MNKLKQFDRSFGVSFSKEEVQAMFVRNIESTIFSKLKKNELGISYYTFMDKFCLLGGINEDDCKNAKTQDLFHLRVVSKSDFVQTLRFVVITYEIIKDSRYAEYLNETIQSIISNLPAPLGIVWIDGSFFRDDIPEITQQLFAENIDWLNEFPAAKIDLLTALKHYSAGDEQGIIDNMYKAIENVIQKVTRSNKALHEPELHKQLLTLLNVSDEWRQFLVKFIAYANTYARHGKNELRHSADPDERESFLYLGLIILRIISKKDKRQATLPVDRDSLLHFLCNNRMVTRIENEIISINPRLKIFTDRTQYNPVSPYLLSNMARLGLKTIGDVEALYLMYEKKLIYETQKDALESEADYYGQGFSLVSLINYVESNDLPILKRT